jgi:hypothetical protein
MLVGMVTPKPKPVMQPPLPPPTLLEPDEIVSSGTVAVSSPEIFAEPPPSIEYPTEQVDESYLNAVDSLSSADGIRSNHVSVEIMSPSVNSQN